MVGQSFRPDHIFSGGGDHILAEWDLNSGEPSGVVAQIPGVIFSSLVIKEKNILLLGDNQGGLHVLDLNTRQELRYLKAHSEGVFHINWNSKYAHIYVFGADGAFSVWDIDTFECLCQKVICKGKIRSSSLSKNGEFIALAGGDGIARYVSCKDFSIIHEWEAHRRSLNSICFDPSGRFILTGGKDAYLKIWDAQDENRLIKEVPAHNYAIYSIAFHPDGHLFATCSMDKTIKIWDARDFNFLLRIDREKYQGHRNSVNSLIWSDFNHYLVSGSDDRTVIVWKIEKITD